MCMPVRKKIWIEDEKQFEFGMTKLTNLGV